MERKQVEDEIYEEAEMALEFTEMLAKGEEYDLF